MQQRADRLPAVPLPQPSPAAGRGRKFGVCVLPEYALRLQHPWVDPNPPLRRFDHQGCIPEISTLCHPDPPE